MTLAIELLAKVLHDKAADELSGNPDLTIVSVVSVNSDKQGQWIIGKPDQDRGKVAQRLRLCADILDGLI
jgi:hypothetical protein